MKTILLNDIYTSMSKMSNIIFDINNLINNNKMKVYIKGDNIYITKNTHHKFKTYITFKPQNIDVCTIDNHHHIIQNDLEIENTYKTETFWITTRTTYLQFLEFIQIGSSYLPNFKKIIIKF